MSSINQLERNVHVVNVGRARTIGLVTGALLLSSPRLALYTRFALLAKCRVCLSWLIKRLLCRLFFYRKQSLGAPGQSCDCFVIAKTMVSVLHANLISCRVGFALSCFTKNLKLFCCSVSWREPFCLTEYLRGRSKILVFILATERNQLRIRSVHFDPLPLGVCFIGTHFVKI